MVASRAATGQEYDPVPQPRQQLLPSRGEQLDLSDELRRADTASIIGDFRGAGAGVVFAGLALAMVYCSIAAVLVWYSTQVPKTCQVSLSTTFRLMGSLDGVLGVLMVSALSSAKGLVDAVSHGVLADKYEREGRLEEAEQQKEESAKKMAGAFLQGFFPTIGFLCIQVGLLGTWIFGIMQAVRADRLTCGSAVMVFWVMLAVNISSGILSGCLELGKNLMVSQDSPDADLAALEDTAPPSRGDTAIPSAALRA